MKIEELKQIIKPYIDDPFVEFVIEKKMFDAENARKMYNEKIRKIVEKKIGIYVWLASETNEIVYIGMAGKIKSDGTIVNHTIQSRLLASRGKIKATKKDIQTSDYVCDFMSKNKIENLNFYIFYTKKEEPPAYIEAILLYMYYKKNKKLPKLNNFF